MANRESSSAGSGGCGGGTRHRTVVVTTVSTAAATANGSASIATVQSPNCLKNECIYNNNEASVGAHSIGDHGASATSNGCFVAYSNDESKSGVFGQRNVSPSTTVFSNNSSDVVHNATKTEIVVGSHDTSVVAIKPSRSVLQSPLYILGGGYWARFGWLPPENILYLREAMAMEETIPLPSDLQEHHRSWLEGGEDSLEDGGDMEVSDPAYMEALLREYLQEEGLEGGGGDAWRLGASPMGGRFGVFATRVLQPGDLLLRDTPLVLGPRAGAAVPPVCAGCHSARRPLRACPRGCGLPVCADRDDAAACYTLPRHQRECRVLVSWRPKRSSRDIAAAAADTAASRTTGGWSPALLRSLCAVRALALPPRRRRLLRALTAHDDPQHAFEVALIRRAVDEAPRACDAAVMALACRAFDANAFETAPGAATAEAQEQAQKAGVAVGAAAEAVGSPTGRCLDGAGATLRALFPLAAMLNHACTPNTRHGYDADGFLRLYAATHIAEGEEFTNSYTPLLWATPARRHLLRFTKHFDCTCKRCADPLEGGAAPSALRCALPDCAGVLLPQRPLETSSPWACTTCGARVRAKEAQAVQAVLGGPLAAIDATDPYAALAALRRLAKPLPPSNHVLLEIKACLVWLLGHKQGFLWHELPDELLHLKESLVRELLHLVELLRAGQCRMQGLLKYELHCTLETQISRLAKNKGVTKGTIESCNVLGNSDNISNNNIICNGTAEGVKYENGLDDMAVHLANDIKRIPSKDPENSASLGSDKEPCVAQKDVLMNGAANGNGDEPVHSHVNENGESQPEEKKSEIASASPGEIPPCFSSRLAMLAVESAASLAEAAAIFADDVTAPLDLQQRVASARLVSGSGGGV